MTYCFNLASTLLSYHIPFNCACCSWWEAVLYSRNNVLCGPSRLVTLYWRWAERSSIWGIFPTQSLFRFLSFKGLVVLEITVVICCSWSHEHQRKLRSRLGRSNKVLKVTVPISVTIITSPLCLGVEGLSSASSPCTPCSSISVWNKSVLATILLQSVNTYYHVVGFTCFGHPIWRRTNVFVRFQGFPNRFQASFLIVSMYSSGLDLISSPVPTILSVVSQLTTVVSTSGSIVLYFFSFWYLVTNWCVRCFHIGFYTFHSSILTFLSFLILSRGHWYFVSSCSNLCHRVGCRFNFPVLREIWKPINHMPACIDSLTASFSAASLENLAFIFAMGPPCVLPSLNEYVAN